jgi:hypothetical protein
MFTLKGVTAHFEDNLRTYTKREVKVWNDRNVMRKGKKQEIHTGLNHEIKYGTYVYT